MVTSPQLVQIWVVSSLHRQAADSRQRQASQTSNTDTSASNERVSATSRSSNLRSSLNGCVQCHMQGAIFSPVPPPSDNVVALWQVLRDQHLIDDLPIGPVATAIALHVVWLRRPIDRVPG
jgi:hypothetical protein